MTSVPPLVFAQLPVPSWLAEEQPAWEHRTEGRMAEYEIAIAMYRRAADFLSDSNWLSPRKAGYDRLVGWLSVKQIADSIAGIPLPPISPADAFALSCSSCYSVEDWYIGCGNVE